jgi:hypothetical protein
MDFAESFVPGMAKIIEQIGLDSQTGLATHATIYQADFFFPGRSMRAVDVRPTFPRTPSPINVVLKFTPHTVGTYFPTGLHNGHLVYFLPAEQPAVGTCGDPGDDDPPSPGFFPTPIGRPLTPIGRPLTPIDTVQPAPPRPPSPSSPLQRWSERDFAALKTILGNMK